MFAIYNVKCNNTITLKSIFNFPIQTIWRRLYQWKIYPNIPNEKR